MIDIDKKLVREITISKKSECDAETLREFEVFLDSLYPDIKGSRESIAMKNEDSSTVGKNSDYLVIDAAPIKINYNPPRFGAYVVRIAMSRETSEALLGDLEEDFEHDTAKYGA